MQTDAQEPIETGKMIHVGMKYERVADTQELSRCKRREITKIEQQRTTAETESMNSPGSENGSLTSVR